MQSCIIILSDGGSGKIICIQMHARSPGPCIYRPGDLVCVHLNILFKHLALRIQEAYKITVLTDALFIVMHGVNSYRFKIIAYYVLRYT